MDGDHSRPLMFVFSFFSGFSLHLKYGFFLSAGLLTDDFYQVGEDNAALKVASQVGNKRSASFP